MRIFSEIGWAAQMQIVAGVNLAGAGWGGGRYNFLPRKEDYSKNPGSVPAG